MIPKFLFDENLSFRIARGLNEMCRHEVVSVVDHPKLGRSSDDVEDIIRVCQDEGWDLLLNDWKIREKPHERAALDDSGIGAFFVFLGKKKQLKFWRQAKMFVDRWPLIEEYALQHHPPFSARVTYRKRGIESL